MKTKTAEEILNKNVPCLNNYMQKDNMIKAMEEYAEQYKDEIKTLKTELRETEDIFKDLVNILKKYQI